MNFEIKEFKEENLIDVLKIESKVFGERGYGMNAFIELINKNNFFYIVQSKEKIIGYVLAGKINKNETKLISIAISPKFQNKGIGSKLIEHLFEEIKENNLNQINLEVRENNKKAIKFYKKMGFKEAGEKIDYYENNEDAIYMTKRFHPSFQKT